MVQGLLPGLSALTVGHSVVKGVVWWVVRCEGRGRASFEAQNRIPNGRGNETSFSSVESRTCGETGKGMRLLFKLN